MPKIGVQKESLEGFPEIPIGRYTFRMDGFKPKKAKSGTSENLNAQLTIINHATQNDKKVFHGCNTTFPPALYDFAHACGIKFEGEDTPNDPAAQFPGEFICKVHGPQCDSSDPENWVYQGPLSGQVGELEVVESDNGSGKKQNKLGRFYCRVPGCQAKHSASLL